MDASTEACLARLLSVAAPLLALLPACAAPPGETVATRIQGDVHFLDGHPARAADGRLNAVIEVPAGTLAKWEVHAESGVLEWEMEHDARRVVQFLAYPCNYGMAPSTLHSKGSGGDGDPLARTRALMGHPRFSLANPNRARSLIGGFAQNMAAFHARGGSGYRFLAEVGIALDASNPQVAARLMTAFGDVRRFDAERRAAARSALQEVAASAKSSDVADIVRRLLTGL